MTKTPTHVPASDAAATPCDAPRVQVAVPQGARLLVGRGARATEELLLERLAPLLEAARADVRLLAKPIRIVVPSRSLRDHVSAAIVRRFGAAVAGVEVQTLQRLAREVLERTQAPARAGEALLPVLVRAAARREPRLASELGALDDGAGAVLGTVRDLLDAGHLVESGDAIDDALAALPEPGVGRERARALVRVGIEVARALEALHIDSRTSLLDRAESALGCEPERSLPRRAIFIHGFADATGVATDLLDRLVRTCGASVLIDQPLDPADPTQPDLGCAFTDRLVARFASEIGPIVIAPSVIQPPEIQLLEAMGTAAEVRGIAWRIRALLDGGAVPESIAVVARTLQPYAAPLREDFGRLGIPFSSFAATAGPDAAGRRMDAILTLLERGGDTTVDRWLAALSPSCVEGALPCDLRLALHALGAARLSAVAELDVERRLQEQPWYALPARHGLALVEEEGGDLRPRASRRRVPAHALHALVDRARQGAATLAAWPAEAALTEHLVRVRALLCNGLGFHESDAEISPISAGLARLEGELPGEIAIDRTDLRLVLRDAFALLRSRPLGGAGAGVQILDAMEARARTFEHLFVIGVQRDVFPRIVIEDPLLPDSLRYALCERGTGVLPELPLKLGGHDEERYLFAQLCSASPHVTLTWQCMGDDGKERAPSTLVERIRLEGRAERVVRLPALWSRPSGGAGPPGEEHAAPQALGGTPDDPNVAGPRPADEHLVLAGLHAGRASVAKLWPLALSEAVSIGAADTALDVLAVARARVAALDLLEPHGSARDRLGPSFGFIGERGDGGSREATLAVTTLERLARCPWQALLSVVLRLTPMPDALAELPAVDPLLLGSVVHASLAAIVERALPTPDRSLAAALLRGSQEARAPRRDELRQILRASADSCLADQGLFAPGLARVLVDRAERLVTEAFEQIWVPAKGAPLLFGAELDGALRVRDGGGTEREIRFRADLAQATQAGVRLIDLKTGRSYSTAKGVATRHRHLRKKIARGTHLQTAVYAHATGGEGAYLYTDRERVPEHPLDTIQASDAGLATALAQTVGTLFTAWDRGSFVPRLVLPDGADAGESPCRACDLSEACSYGDSGARQRMQRWAKSDHDGAGPALAALVAARAVFALPAAGGGDDEVKERESS